jgi:Eco29kI restriction endonuclease
MAYKAFSFDFLDTISRQLQDELQKLEITQLNDATLDVLRSFQKSNDAMQGVYLVHLDGVPVYLGKANDVCERLSQHYGKIKGRLNLDISKIGFKALLLDKSMSTAANEDLLIAMFKETHSAMWNGNGFGPKDPGKERDTTKPSPFDKAFPIKQDWPLDFRSLDQEKHNVGAVLATMKLQLPYLFRYKLDKESKKIKIDPDTLPKTAVEALASVVKVLGKGWKGAVLAYGLVLYKNSKNYPYGRELLP